MHNNLIGSQKNYAKWKYTKKYLHSRIPFTQNSWKCKPIYSGRNCIRGYWGWQGRGRWEGRITKCQEETVVGGGYVHQADCEHGFVNVHVCQKSNCTLKICGICCRSILSYSSCLSKNISHYYFPLTPSLLVTTGSGSTFSSSLIGYPWFSWTF